MIIGLTSINETHLIIYTFIMNKSHLKYTSIDEYHHCFDANIQQKLKQLRMAIQEAAPKAIEGISYGMPAFKMKKPLAYYAVNKHHIGFYPTPSPILQFAKQLTAYKTSKGAVQFPLDQPLPLPLIIAMVRYRAKEIL